MKKMTVFLLILLLMLTVFVSCGESEESSTAPDTTNGGTDTSDTTGDTADSSTVTGSDTPSPDTSTSPDTTVKPPISGEVESDLLYPLFESPAANMTAKPLWFWNTSLENMTTDYVREIVRESYQQSGYSGFGILPYWLDGYLGELYFELYEAALNEGAKYGMQFSLYDENGFPSYTAGGHLADRYPHLTAKRLDMTESARVKNGKIFLKILQGEYMGAVAWNKTTGEIIDISSGAVIVDLGEFDPAQYPIGPTASSTYTKASGYEIDKAFDGNKATRWNAYQHSGSGSYITVNFGEAVTFDEVKIYEPNSTELERTQGWSVSYYDETENAWKPLAKGTTIGRNGKSLTFDEVKASFLRITFDTVNGDSATISEIEVLNDGKSVKVPTTPPASSAGYSASSSFFEQYIADYAFDNDPSTRWNAEDGKRTNQWIAIDFGKDVTINRMKVEEAFGRVTSYAIQYQKPDGTWADCYTGQKLGANCDVSFNAVTAQRFRLMMKSVSSDTASIVECKFFFGEDEVYIEEDLSQYHGSYIEYTVPNNDNWTVMAFVTVKDGHKGMDYLSEESVAAFIEITYEEYYKRFKEYFDNGTITFDFDFGYYYLNQGGETVYYVEIEISNITGGCAIFSQKERLSNQYTVNILNTANQERKTFYYVNEGTQTLTARYYSNVYDSSFRISINDAYSTYVYSVAPKSNDPVLVDTPAEHHSWDAYYCGYNATCSHCGKTETVPHVDRDGRCIYCNSTTYYPKFTLPNLPVMLSNGQIECVSIVAQPYTANDYFVDLTFTFYGFKSNNFSLMGYRIFIYNSQGILADSRIVTNGSEVPTGDYKYTLKLSVLASSSYTIIIESFN